MNLIKIEKDGYTEIVPESYLNYGDINIRMNEVYQSENIMLNRSKLSQQGYTPKQIEDMGYNR